MRTSGYRPRTFVAIQFARTASRAELAPNCPAIFSQSAHWHSSSVSFEASET